MDARRPRSSGSTTSRSASVTLANVPDTACSASSRPARPCRRNAGATPSPSSSIAPSRGSAGADTARPTTLEPTTAAETRAGSADKSPAAIRSCAPAGSAGATTRGCNASRAQVVDVDRRKDRRSVPAISSADAGINPEAGTIGFHHPRSTASLTSRGIVAQRARSATSSAREVERGLFRVKVVIGDRAVIEASRGAALARTVSPRPSTVRATPPASMSAPPDVPRPARSAPRSGAPPGTRRSRRRRSRAIDHRANRCAS